LEERSAIWDMHNVYNVQGVSLTATRCWVCLLIA